MNPKITSKWRDRLLIAGVVVLQTALLITGWVLTLKYLESRVSQGVEDLIVQSNADYAEGISGAIGQISGDLKIGDAEWERVQTVIESLDFPGAGYACVLNENGYIIAHPSFRGNPDMGQMTYADMPFLKTHDGQQLALYKIDATQPVEGKMTFLGDGIHYVVTRQVNDAGYRLMVHQPLSGLNDAGLFVTHGLQLTAIFIGLVIVVSTGLLSWVGIQRHHRALREWNSDLENEVERRVQQFARSRDGLILGLAKLADFRDNETGQHLERICRYSAMLAEELAKSKDHPYIDDAWIQRLRLAASMHDIGKVGVPDNVLLKPGKLTDAEYNVIKTHPNMGTDTLIAIRQQFDNDPLIDMSIEVTLGHHERWDGKGYPLGISGDSIPMSARIVSVADVYDALTVKRVYKPAMPHDKAAAIIQDGRGTQFDPAVVDAFLRIQHELKAVADSLRDPEEHDSSTAA